jgi:hypothetical protein
VCLSLSSKGYRRLGVCRESASAAGGPTARSRCADEAGGGRGRARVRKGPGRRFTLAGVRPGTDEDEAGSGAVASPRVWGSRARAGSRGERAGGQGGARRGGGGKGEPPREGKKRGGPNRRKESMSAAGRSACGVVLRSGPCARGSSFGDERVGGGGVGVGVVGSGWWRRNKKKGGGLLDAFVRRDGAPIVRREVL